MPDNDLRLLALDGGGVRGLSTLQIVKQLMDTIDPKSPPKPCDYFDMIGGTSTGGLIAIMLGRLRMTVDECIDAYVSLSDRIFQKQRHRVTIKGQVQGRFDSEELERAIKEIVVRQGLAEDALLKDAPDAKCKVFVCATSSETGDTVRLTSYRSPRGREQLLRTTKIWEAGRATSAASSFFGPITIGNFGECFTDGATGANNPVYEVWNEAQDIWPSSSLENKIKCLVSIGTGVPSLTPFKDDLVSIGQSLLAIATETEKTAERFSRDKSRLGDMGRYCRFNVLRGLEGIGLEDSKRKNAIIAATDRYIESQAVFRQMKALVSTMTEVELSGNCSTDNLTRKTTNFHFLERLARSMREDRRTREAGLRCVLHAHSLQVNAVAFSPDMKTVASGSMDGILKIWKIETGTLVHELNVHMGPVNAIAFSPDGKVIASGSADSKGRIWDTESWKLTNELSGHAGSINSLVFSPNGLLILSGSSDCTVKVWSAGTGKLSKEFNGHRKAIRAVAFSFDASIAVSGAEDGTVKAWNVDSGELFREPVLSSESVNAVACSPVMDAIVCGFADGKVRVYKGTITNAISNANATVTELEGHWVAVTAVAFSADGQKIASGSKDRKVRLWHTGSRAPLRELEGHEGPVTSTTFSLDGKMIASASSDTTVRLWDLDVQAESR